eukprot:5623432-Pyramimonas_sp.AAC.1
MTFEGPERGPRDTIVNSVALSREIVAAPLAPPRGRHGAPEAAPGNPGGDDVKSGGSPLACLHLVSS